MITLLIGVLTSPTQAQFIGWHPQLPLVLGSGVDIHHQKSVRQSPVILSATPAGIIPPNSSPVDITYAQHNLDIAKSLNLNASVSVDSLVASGSVGFSLADSSTFSQNTVNFVYSSKRDFGTPLYAPVAFTSAFTNDLNTWKQTLSGDELKKAITDKYGTHFVSGVHTMARVSALYTFEYASQSTAQSYALSLQGSYSGVDFSSTVQSQFNRTDTQVNMTYHFDTTGNLVPRPQPIGSITTFQQFQDFTTQLNTYADSLGQTNGAITEYLLTPIDQIPGWVQLVDNNPNNFVSADYPRFMNAYGQLKHWDTLLNYWTTDPRRMSWLNTNGQQLVVSLRADTTTYLRSLEDIARQHFTSGTPLLVPDTVFNYFANFSRIPLPTINTLYQVQIGSGSYVKIGYIMCGPKALTRDKAFAIVKAQLDGADYGSSYCQTMAEFAANPQNYGPDFDAMNSPLWQSLAALTNNTQILIFHTGHPALDSFSIHLQDDAGNTVDRILLRTLESRLSPQSYEASPNASLSFGVVNRAALATVDTSAVHEFGVTNNGPGAAHGISVSLPIPVGLQVLSVGGTQGSGAMTNGNVVYNVGPLASGNTARIRLKVAATTTNTLTPASLASTAIGAGLNNIGTNSSSALTPITVNPPSLTHTRKADHVELNWVSDTGLLNVESSSRVGASAVWGGVSTPPTLDAGRRKLRLPFDSNATFYRLRSQ